MLSVEIVNPDQISESKIAITPNTSAPYPGEEIPINIHPTPAKHNLRNILPSGIYTDNPQTVLLPPVECIPQFPAANDDI